ncbi:MAG: hypothetical protein M3Q49_11485 [Actinomycetota bacterium]|nr:hypothetical protein [Actinomycetota bacterium]
MDAERIMDVRRRVYGEVNEAREALGDLEARVNAIWADAGRFTVEARTEDVAREIQNGRGVVEAHLESAREVVDGAYAGVTEALDAVRAVDPEDLRVRAAILAPTLVSASSEPARLVNLYRQRHRVPADRRIIEEAALAEIDARGSSDSFVFRDEWAGVEKELALSRDPEELEALSGRDDLDEVYAYLDNVERVVRAGLLTMDPTWRGDRAHLGVNLARAIAAINVFEGSIPAEEGVNPHPPYSGASRGPVARLVGLSGGLRVLDPRAGPPGRASRRSSSRGPLSGAYERP